jgi:hypothetical protein
MGPTEDEAPERLELMMPPESGDDLQPPDRKDTSGTVSWALTES